jgi:hypothetical protein
MATSEPEPRKGASGSSVPPAPTWRLAATVAAFSAATQTAAWTLLYFLFGVLGVGYRFFDMSDIAGTYYPYAVGMSRGLVPFRDFFIEYPPLFVPLIWAAGDPAPESAFMVRFALLMMLFMLGAGVATSLAALESREPWRAWATAAVFSAAVLALGPIAVNRYDAAVAFVLALALLAMVRSNYEVAGVLLGLGFALKVTPAVLLPLVLMVAPTRRAVRALAGFTAAAAIPFGFVLALGGRSATALGQMLAYHLSRPLEIESVLATPLWVARLAGADTIRVALTAGSQVIESAGADLIAKLSAVALALALGATFALVWRRRAAVAAEPRFFALAALATMLGSLVGSKVLSPQYFVWILPAIALVAIDRRVLGGLLGVALVLTHLEFPANYWTFALSQEPGPIAIVIARNVVLVAAFGLSLWHLWKLPTDAT